MFTALAAAAQMAIGELAAAALGLASTPLRAIGRWLIDVLPGPLVDVTIAILEHRDKPALLLSLVALWIGGGAIAANVGGATAAALFLGAIGLISLAALLRRREIDRRRATLVAVLTAAAGPAALWYGSPAILAIATAAALAATAVLRRRSRSAPAAGLPAESERASRPALHGLDVPGLSPLITPVDRFYVTDVTFPPPRVDATRWRLDVAGLVERPFSVSYAELLAMESLESDVTLVCVHNPVGGSRIGTARWRGVPLAALLERAGIASNADHVLVSSVDGFSGGLSLPLGRGVAAPLVAYAMNGEPLTRDHGAPARVLAPGIYGYDANVKWLARLEVTRFELARDYWEKKGWPRHPASVRTQSRIDVPRNVARLRTGPHIVAGVAWAPPSGVTRVEISVDGGPWHPCELGAELSPSAWRQWRYPWAAPPGRHVLTVRAWSGEFVQEAADAGPAPYPRGAAGHHTIAVEVDEEGRRGAADVLRAVAVDVAGRVRLARAGARAWSRRRDADREG